MVMAMEDPRFPVLRPPEGQKKRMKMLGGPTQGSARGDAVIVMTVMAVVVLEGDILLLREDRWALSPAGVAMTRVEGCRLLMPCWRMRMLSRSWPTSASMSYEHSCNGSEEEGQRG